MQESRCKVIAITNQKEGVGKTTTTTFNLGVALAKQCKKVLIVDVDPQSNLTTYAGWYNEEDLSRGQIRNDEVEVFEREKEISIHNTTNEQSTFNSLNEYSRDSNGESRTDSIK